MGFCGKMEPHCGNENETGFLARKRKYILEWFGTSPKLQGTKLIHSKLVVQLNKAEERFRENID